MDIKINSKVVEKVKDKIYSLKSKDSNVLTKRRRKINSLNKSYFAIFFLMIGIMSMGIIKNNGENKELKENVAPVFSNNEKEEPFNNIDTSNLDLDITIPVNKEDVISYQPLTKMVQICLKKGSKVLSMTDGVVENVFLDYAYGYSIVVSYNEDIKCKYSNLDEKTVIKIGDIVKKGDVLGKTLDYSLLDSSYIYISIYDKNEAVDITKYINI